MTTSLPITTYVCALALAFAGASARPAAAGDTVKVAFWNIMSGKGVDALPGFSAPFVNTSNCTDPSQPLNAWGAGASQAALAAIAGDSSLVAIGLAEAWDSVCGSPERVRAALGWSARTSERNGVAIVARYGFAGPEQWQQLDTSLNTTPGDTMWVVRVPVCLDTACTQSLLVYSAHWYGTGANASTTYQTQAQQTATFLRGTSNNLPHVFVGDLNVWEGSAGVCNQNPTNTALPLLRNAGYYDAWLTVHGSAEGFTGMINRAGCGNPAGYAWKRIDYAWTPAAFQPLDIKRFGQAPVAGDASPSDHFGILVTLPNPFGSAPPPPPPPPTDAMWKSSVNATISGATLTKSSGCGTCFDAGAIGTQTIAAGGSITFSAGNGQRLVAGLGSDTSASTSFATIDYGFSFWPSGTWEIREKNVYRKEGTFGATDRFTIAVDGTTVKYFRNDSLVYTSAVPVPGPLVFDTSLASLGATVRNLTAVASTSVAASADVIWTSLVKSTAIGAALAKASGCSTCFDAGAISQQQITGDATLSFTVGQGQRLFVGLNTDTSSNAGYVMDYSFSFAPGGTFEIRERNVYRGEGMVAPGDVYKIASVSGVVKYYRNDMLIYTSRTAVSGALVVDASLATLGTGITAASVR
jgi:hypothetical protein